MPEPRKPGQGRRWALQDAKNKLSEVVRAAAVVISHDDFERLSGAAGSGHGSLAAGLLAMPSSEEVPDFERVELAPRELVE